MSILAFSERVMPYFAQEPLSYLTLPTIKNAYKAFSIKINFRPDNVDGKEVQPQISWTVNFIIIFLILFSAVMFFYFLYYIVYTLLHVSSCCV